MKFLKITLVLSLFVVFAFAQKTANVKGVAVDGKTGEAIGFATVNILTLDNKVLMGGQTNLDGEFNFQKVELGGFIIKISFVGYQNFTRSFTVDGLQPSVNLGSLKLVKSETSVLNEVVVTAKKDVIQLGIDRKIFNADQSMVSEGGSATDLLATVPSVQVDLDGTRKELGVRSARVTLANELFSSSAEGWQTDKGMIFIIMGPPDRVQRSKDREDGEQQQQVVDQHRTASNERQADPRERHFLHQVSTVHEQRHAPANRLGEHAPAQRARHQVERVAILVVDPRQLGRKHL